MTPDESNVVGSSERPLLKSLTDRKGSRSDRPHFEFIAGKQALKFRFLEAASRHRALRAHCSRYDFSGHRQQNSGSCRCRPGNLLRNSANGYRSSIKQN